MRRNRHHGRKGAIFEVVKTNGKTTAFARRAFAMASSNEPDTPKLARLIAAYAPHDGSFELRVPDLHVSRFSRVNGECVHTLRLPSLCLIAQGAKTVIVGQGLPVRHLAHDRLFRCSPCCRSSYASQLFRTLSFS